MYKKCRQILHFLSKLSKFEVSQRVLSTFCQAVVQSVLLYCFMCYHSSLSAETMNKLGRLVKQAAKSIHVTPLRSLLCHYMTKKTYYAMQHIHCIPHSFQRDQRAVYVHVCTHCPLQQIFCTTRHRALNS